MSKATHKDVLKFRGTSRDVNCVKMIIFPSELKQRPIKFWATLISGCRPKSKLMSVVDAVKRQVSVKWANGVLYMTYDGSVDFYFSLQWWKNNTEFEMTISAPLSNGLRITPRYSIRRKVSSKYERFTNEEIKGIADFLREETLFVHRVVRRELTKIDNKKNESI